jgi:hypothetical protein
MVHRLAAFLVVGAAGIAAALVAWGPAASRASCDPSPGEPFLEQWSAPGMAGKPNLVRAAYPGRVIEVLVDVRDGGGPGVLVRPDRLANVTSQEVEALVTNGSLYAEDAMYDVAVARQWSPPQGAIEDLCAATATAFYDIPASAVRPCPDGGLTVYDASTSRGPHRVEVSCPLGDEAGRSFEQAVDAAFREGRR